MLLGTPAGTVDLRTGELRRARQADMISNVAAVGPAGEFHPDFDCPLWQWFLHETTGGDAGLIRFLQQLAGYCLTGDTREQALFFFFGSGRNGKGVFLRTIAGILGDYAKEAPMETFAESSFDRHPTELARLQGARLVTATETQRGRAWNETLIKKLTGGDIVTARFMRENFFEYLPQFKLLFSGNHKPALRTVDVAIQARFNIVPFTRKPAVLDLMLEEKLKSEWPGILSWMIAGCLDWRANGLVRPQIMLDATTEYFLDQDIMGRWLTDCCELGKPYKAMSAELYASYSEFTRGSGKLISNMSFSKDVEERGFEKHHTRNGAEFYGLRIREDDL